MARTALGHSGSEGHSRHGLVEVGQVLLRGVEEEDGGSLGAQQPIPGGAARLRGQVEGVRT